MKHEIKKAFDAVRMKRKIQAEIYEKTKSMTPEQETAYYRNAVETGPFAEKVHRIRMRREQGAKKKKAS